LIRLARAHPDWALGFEDETWWSRLAHPTMHVWSDPVQPTRWIEKTRPANDLDPKALACYGLLVRWVTLIEPVEQLWLRFVLGRPVSALTIQFLEWCCEKVAAAGKRALLLVWDNASWHISQAVREWLRTHNQQVKQSGQGVRLVITQLPTKSPWLNPIEPKWLHGKRRIAEPEHTLTAHEIMQRVCATFDCPFEAPLTIPAHVS
jgi:transposase